MQVALTVIWGTQADNVEELACVVLGVKNLADYFSSPAKFFADHFKCYSKSSRKAPIYWPLSTASGRYTLWLYYPRIGRQTLHTALLDFVEPKLEDLKEPIAALRAKGKTVSSDESRRLADMQELQIELIEFRERLSVLAARYEPNIDDGVLVTAAPLWELFRHKPWQKMARDTWNKLERVRRACVTDKSLAIAHGCEDLYQTPEITGKGQVGRRKRQ